MNLFSLNSSAINSSAILALVLATVTINCTANVSANASHSMDATVQTAATGQVSAIATVNRYVTSNINGIGSIHAVAIHTQAAQINIVGSSEIQLIVFRDINAAVIIECTANVTPYAGDLLGGAYLNGIATIVANGTREHPGAATIECSGTTINAIIPLVTRFVSAVITGSGNLRAETRIQGIHETYANVIGSANVSLPDTGIVFKISESQIESSANSIVTVTYNHFAYVSINCANTMQLAEPHLYNIGGVGIVGTAIVTATAYRTAIPTGIVILGSSSLSINASQTHSGNVVINGNSTITVSYDISLAANSNLVSNALVTANAIVIRMVEADIESIVEVDINEELIEIFSVLIQAQANIINEGILVIAGGFITNPATVNINCYCTVYADVIANPESYDPPGRTFKRLAQVVDFIRPLDTHGFGRV